MYLVSVIDDQSVIEASLGGSVDLVEMKTFAEELREVFQEWNGQPFYLLLDYSKARAFDRGTAAELDALKDQALSVGAAKIFSIPQEGMELEEHVSPRLQLVLEGKEEYLADPDQAAFAPLPSVGVYRAA